MTTERPILHPDASHHGLAEVVREAAHIWRTWRERGDANEHMRPAVMLPNGRVHVVGDLTMAIADTFEFLDDAGFAMTQISSDYTADTVVWVSADGRFIDVGVSSCWSLMVGYLDNGSLPEWSLETHRHARDIVPPDIARHLPSIELPSSVTDITFPLPACAQWIQAVLTVSEW